MTRDILVQDFLDRMARAITAGEGRVVAAMWDVPALIVGDDEVRAVASRHQLEPFFSSTRDQYNERGITDTRAQIVRMIWLTDRIVQVDVRWPYLDAAGQEVGAEASQYTLRRDDADDLKLRVAVMRGVEPPR